MTEEWYPTRYPLPDNVLDFVSGLRKREREGEIESLQVSGYIRDLSEAGWSLRALANAMNGSYIQAPRERIARVRKHEESNGAVTPIPGAPEIPLSPSRIKSETPPEPKPAKPERYKVPADKAEQMKRLFVLAKNLRRTTKNSTVIPYHAASLKLSILMEEEYNNGASFVEIGHSIGITWSAVKLRLGRYGIYPLPPSAKWATMENLSDPDVRKSALKIIADVERSGKLVEDYADVLEEMKAK